MTIRNLYPDIRPSLNLDFANSKRLDSRITFTRASTGTYTDESGIIRTAAQDEARFDHDSDGNSLGLLIEAAGTNLVAYSEALSSWSSVACSAAVVTETSGMPSLNHNKLTVTALSNFPQRHIAVGSASGTHTLSCYIKSGSTGVISIGTGSPYYVQNAGARFNVSTGTIVSVSSGSTADIQPVGSGWYRCAVTVPNLSSYLRIFFPGNTPVNEYLYVTGVQVEASPYPTSYIPTSGSTVTRSADVASMTGTNFSSWYNQSEGTAFVKSTNKNIARSPVAFSVGAYLFSFFTLLENYNNTSAFVLRVYDSNTAQVDITSTTINPAGTSNTVAGAVKANDFAVSVNGATALTDSSGTLPTFDTLKIGRTWSNDAYSGHISRLTYYPVRLPDATLQALTL